MEHHEFASHLFGEQNHVSVVKQRVGEPAGANPRFEIFRHRQARQRRVGAQIARELRGAFGVEVFPPHFRLPKLAKGVMPASIGDVEPISHLDDARILDGGPVESLDTRAERRLVRRALELVAVLAFRQAEPAFVIRLRFSRAIEQEHLLLSIIVPSGGVEDRQILPGMIRVWRKDRVAFVTFEFHRV